ncbi:SUMF1/EgtB/PvdO family nonheme iron enzyme [Halomonas vilamensis]|uniref:SUMF1/EgtB/PvdO family nonheme iron enzyme n=1 Tax=Vreelandella vilamensis TaxID=531309 RepID=A0ABU1H7L1_9GAMM|nr:SUMF1/EgtB/PvdO family nonheme iron enzyme [Halomonas vilamensis]MDR5900290.1 SUMF1/EgtB/PvdO family nonheme iron enzyme [Halomonas vilamensis]
MKPKNHFVALFATLTASLGITFSVQAQPEWDERLYNPSPLEDDVILPMPCGGAMAFRQIHVPVSKPLEDFPVQIGQDGTGWGYVEHSRPAFISGSFTSEDGEASRYYLLAKYELTELQYEALVGKECPPLSNRKRFPQVALSWFDAMQLSDAYNLWLREHASKMLPREDGSLGFLRLPTEVEWEFAARGGLEVSTAEYRDSRYPMPEGLNAYEWFSGAQSSNGRLQLAGLLAPNPLGLHDVLGNATEMIFEPFRLNKLDRQHGQAGGFVVRGGSYLTPREDLRGALRGEEPYYGSDEHNRGRATGLRLALVAPTLTSRERIAAIEESWASLGLDEEEIDGSPGTVVQLAELASDVEDRALQEQLQTLERQLRASNQRQQEARNQAIRASLNLGAFLCTKLEDDGVFFDFLADNYRLNCEGDEPDASCDMRQARLAEQKKRLEGLSRYYASSLVESATLYGREPITQQVEVFSEILSRNPKVSELRPYLQTYWQHQRQYLNDQHITAEAWLESCKAMATQ